MGAEFSGISSAVEDLGIVPSTSDKILKTKGIGGEMKFFYKHVDEIKIGNPKKVHHFTEKCLL